MKTTRMVAALLLAISGAAMMPDAAIAGGVRNRNDGIRLRVRIVRSSGVVAIRWQASKSVRRRTAEYVFQYWTEEGWSSFLYTSQGNDRGHPVHAQLPGDDRSFCFRMIAVGEGGEDEGPIVGRGTSGNEGPCT